MNTITKKALSISIGILIVLVGGAFALTRYYKAPLAPESPQSYVIKEGKVYYRTLMDVSDGAQGYQTIVNDSEVKGAEAKTFTALDSYWGKDKTNVFYSGQMVLPEEGTPHADISSFTMIESSGGIGKDNRAVYVVFPTESVWKYKLIQDADPATFALVQGGPYAKDKKYVYYLDLPFDVRKIEGADGSSFAVLGQCAAVEVSRAYYGVDAKSVIAGDKILAGADRNTFRIVANYDNGPEGMYVAGTYSVDKNHVYKNCGVIVPTGDPNMCSSGNLKACE
jgi:hypothetical protein